MRTLFLSFLLLFCASSVFAQSEFLESRKNSFSVSGIYAGSKDFSEKGLGLTYTIKGNTNLNISYGRSKNLFNNEYALTGNSIGVLFSYGMMNEIDGDALGIQLGAIYEFSSYQFDTGQRGNLKGHSAGLQLLLTKRIENENPVPALLKLGIKAAPYSEYKTESPFWANRLDHPSDNQFNDQFITVSFSPVIELTEAPRKVAIEPGFNYDFVDKVPYFTLNLTTFF